MSDWAAVDDLGVGLGVLPAARDGRGGLRVAVRGAIDRTGEFDAWTLDELVLAETDSPGAGGTQAAYLALVGRTIVTAIRPTGGVP